MAEQTIFLDFVMSSALVRSSTIFKFNMRNVLETKNVNHATRHSFARRHGCLGTRVKPDVEGVGWRL